VWLEPQAFSKELLPFYKSLRTSEELLNSIKPSRFGFPADGCYLKRVAGFWEHVLGPRRGHGSTVSLLSLLCPFTMSLLQCHIGRLSKFS